MSQRSRPLVSTLYRPQQNLAASTATKLIRFPQSSDRCDLGIFSSIRGHLRGSASSSAVAFSTSDTNLRDWDRPLTDGASATTARTKKTWFSYLHYRNEISHNANHALQGTVCPSLPSSSLVTHLSPKLCFAGAAMGTGTPSARRTDEAELRQQGRAEAELQHEDAAGPCDRLIDRSRGTHTLPSCSPSTIALSIPIPR